MQKPFACLCVASKGADSFRTRTLIQPREKRNPSIGNFVACLNCTGDAYHESGAAFSLGWLRHLTLQEFPKDSDLHRRKAVLLPRLTIIQTVFLVYTWTQRTIRSDLSIEIQQCLMIGVSAHYDLSRTPWLPGRSIPSTDQLCAPSRPHCDHTDLVQAESEHGRSNLRIELYTDFTARNPHKIRDIGWCITKIGKQ